METVIFLGICSLILYIYFFFVSQIKVTFIILNFVLSTYIFLEKIIFNFGTNLKQKSYVQSI